jgi:hypothetical protein
MKGYVVDFVGLLAGSHYSGAAEEVLRASDRVR